MSKVAIVYWSGSGNTKLMAKNFETGANGAGADATLFTASSFTSDDIANFDAFAFGCPACGAEELDETEFLPMWEAAKGSLEDKPVILFGSYGWGGGEWLETWKSESADVNIIADLACEGEPDEDAQQQCEELGKKLA